jgi:hypothetical protein
MHFDTEDERRQWAADMEETRDTLTRLPTQKVRPGDPWGYAESHRKLAVEVRRLMVGGLGFEAAYAKAKRIVWPDQYREEA